MRYKFFATVTKIAVSTKKMKDEAGEPIETPKLIITLEAVHGKAAEGAAKLIAFQGTEVAIDLEGDARYMIAVTE